jgi:hypothetical protein
MPDSSSEPISAAELHRLLGDLDDATSARILATGASEAEIVEARQWLTADDQLGTELEHGRRGVVGEVYEILSEVAAPLEEPGR